MRGSSSSSFSSTFDASIVGIRGEARRTKLAHSLVILHLAGRPIRTLLLLAGVAALIADAGQVAGAAPVLQTDGDRRVAALHTHAHRLVVQHLALLPLGAQLVGLAARTAALTGLAAGLVGGAVAVLATLRLAVRTGQRPLVVDNQAVLALTHRLVVGHHALLVALAEQRAAGVETLAGVAVAGRHSAAIAVLLTAADRRLFFFFDDGHRTGGAGGVEATADMRLADVALGALAARLVQHHATDGVVAAGCPPAAGVHAAARQAGQVGGAVRVCVAASLCPDEMGCVQKELYTLITVP
jgi:hypothetical protein